MKMDGGIDNGVGEDFNIFGDNLFGVFSQAVAEAVSGGLDEVMEEEGREQAGGEEIEDKIKNTLDDAAVVEDIVKENPTFKRMVSQLEKMKKEFKMLEKFNLEQGKQILILEEQVKSLTRLLQRTS